MHQFSFEPVSFPPVAEALRGEVRAFLAEEVANGTFTPRKTIGTTSQFDTRTRVTAAGASDCLIASCL